MDIWLDYRNMAMGSAPGLGLMGFIVNIKRVEKYQQYCM